MRTFRVSSKNCPNRDCSLLNPKNLCCGKLKVPMDIKNSFGSSATLRVRDREYQIFRLEALERQGVGALSRIPYSIRILLENMLRFEDGRTVRHTDIEYVA